MLRNLAIAWATPELRRRLQFVIMMFAVFVLGLHIPVPGVNHRAMEELLRTQGFGILQMFDLFSGGAFRRFTIFAMGITPYINASIMMQLLCAAIPAWDQLRKEGEAGRKTIARWTRWLTVGLAVFQALGLTVMLGNLAPAGQPVFEGGLLTRIQVAVGLTAGTCLLLWMGEMITERGIGQGVSLIIFAGIMARLPWEVSQTFRNFSFEGVGAGASVGPLNLLLLAAVFVGIVVLIVYVHLGTRRIPIQHAKKTVGTRVVQASTSYMPFKVNVGGVIPIIFAISLMMFPATLLSVFRNYSGQGLDRFAETVQYFTTPGAHWFPSLVYAGLIFAFTYFYAAIIYNIQEMSENLKKYGSYIPGYRPGRPTHEYLDRVFTRITFAGAVFLAFVGMVQYYVPQLTGVTTFSLVGGTSVLIVVGVALDTMQNLESHLVMRNYGGFIRQQGPRRRGGASLGGLRLS